MTNQSVFKTTAGQATVMALYDELLTRWPVVHKTMMIPTRHGDTFVIASGDEQAPPLVLLHGAGSNSAVWAGDVATYAAEYRVIAIDTLGEPGRSAQNRLAMDGPGYAEWLSDVFDGLGIGRGVLVGISQGGWMALNVAVTHPDRVAALALMCPGGIVSPRWTFLPRAVGLSLLGGPGLRRLSRLLFGEDPIPDGVVEITATVNQHFNSRMDPQPLFTDEELARLTMPVLLLGGAHDIIFDMEKIAARMRQVMPQTVVEISPTAGHAIIHTAGRICQFLAAQRALA